MLETVTIAVNGDAQQLLSLLLLQCTHLLFEHLAMQSALPFMLNTLEFDTLDATSQPFVHQAIRQYGTHS